MQFLKKVFGQFSGEIFSDNSVIFAEIPDS